MPASISRRRLLQATASLASTAWAIPLFGRSQTSSARPNIIFLLADDLRYDAVGYMNKRVHTPHLDRLAGEGVRFRNAFVTTSICAVSRASIFTGMYARRHRLCNFSTPLPPELIKVSYPALLRGAGYRTGFFGKYGVGDGIESGTRLGAQSSAGRDGFDVIENYGFSYYFDGDEKKRHIHSILADQSEQFIHSTPAGQPFCLSLSFVSPHEATPHESWTEDRPLALKMPAERDMLAFYEQTVVPDRPLISDTAFQSLPEHIRRSLARELWSTSLANPADRLAYVRSYYALVSGIDRVIGRILKILEARDALDNTAIVFTSDNGYFLGDYQLHRKWFGYEPSIRVPLMIRPAGQAVSRDVSETVLNIDLAPTLLGMAGVSIPGQMQGRDLSPLWTGASTEPWRQDFLYEHLMCDAMGKPATDSEKFIPSSEGVRDARYTYLRYPYEKADSELLFDRQVDPNELTNIIHSASPEVLERLRRRTDQLIDLNT